MCDGQKAMIPHTLYSALLRIREIMSPSTLWIDALGIYLWADALCINQSRDPAALREREQQVRTMSRIFSNAQEVIADLGDSPKYLDDLLHVFNRFYQIPDDQWPGSPEGTKPIEELFDLIPSHPFYDSMISFISRPWFRRVWVVQEVVLARTVSAMIGVRMLHFDYLAKVLERALTYPLLIMTSLTLKEMIMYDADAFVSAVLLLDSFIAMLQIRRERNKSQRSRPSFSRVLELGSSLNATDPRDRIYGLYGLAGSELTAGITVSYSRSAHILSSQVSRYIIDSGHGIYALSRAGGPGEGRPSWSVDLQGSKGIRKHSNTLPASALNEDGSCDPYRACGITDPDIRFTQDDLLLVVSGAIIDSLTVTTDIMPYQRQLGAVEYLERTLPSERLAQKARLAYDTSVWHKKNFSSFSESFSDLSSEEMRDAYWRTCVGDCTIPNTRLASHPIPDLARTFEGLEAFYNWFKHSYETGELGDEASAARHAAAYKEPQHKSILESVGYVSIGKRMCQTTHRRIGLVPQTVLPGDKICIFLGAPIPFVIRPTGTRYQLMGPCYLHGMMDGQALELDDWHVEDIVLE